MKDVAFTKIERKVSECHVSSANTSAGFSEQPSVFNKKKMDNLVICVQESKDSQSGDWGH